MDKTKEQSQDKRWTDEQIQAIEDKGANLLISAAAGSGKTTVLIERIVRKILNDGVNVDDLLVVTFTNAAASEMKERLLKALYQKLDENPDNENLQKQISLINRAHISTIHSFCLDVIRNNFFETSLPANFRIADDSENEIIRQEAMEKVFEDKYEAKDKKFLSLLERYTNYKDDQPLKDLVDNFYRFISSVPFPHKWLEDAINQFSLSNVEEFGETPWGESILKYAKEKFEIEAINANQIRDRIKDNTNLAPWISTIDEDIKMIESFDISSWDEAYQKANAINSGFQTWSSAKKGLTDEDIEIKDRAKDDRNEIKKRIKKITEKYFKFDSRQAINDIREMYPVLIELRNLLYEFEEEYTRRKAEKNIIDFNDIEHIALKLLIDENGEKTEIAKKYSFNEILVDEYQDSNLIQESILNSVSNGHNIFMVGDVKQSIYRFREARPELFQEKYERYELATPGKSELETETKVQLYKNFRSRKQILDFTNTIFKFIMSKELGEMDYTEEEYLNYGASYEEPSFDVLTEMYVIEKDAKEAAPDVWKDEEIEENDDESEETSDEEEAEVIEWATLEADLLCTKIKELHDHGVQYRDMCVLMRSPTTMAPVFEKEMIESGIPVFTDVGSDYLHTIEIDTMLSLLNVIDNPLQDIPLITAMRSPIGGFNDNDLVDIRLFDREKNFYYALQKAYVELNPADINHKDLDLIEVRLYEKIRDFLNLIDDLRQKEKVMPLDELIWYIFTKTGYYHYVLMMPYGKIRQANLRKLFEKAKEYESISFKGLFNFITFIERVANKPKNTIGAAKIIGENEDVVRIMSIHKSKGLEFPVVFLCGVGKQFNLQDLSNKVIFNQDLGLGVDFINEYPRYPTLAKEAINIKARNEAISEEMRLLYVALTRAKEKLVIIGSDKKAEENYKKKGEEIRKFFGYDKKEKLSSKILSKYVRYIDWIELVNQATDKLNLNINFIAREDVERPEVEEDTNKFDLKKIETNLDKAKYQKIDELLKWEYKDKVRIDLQSKTSVTALKNSKLAFENSEVILLDSLDEKEKKYDEDIFQSFDGLKVDREEELNSAQKGTLIHKALEKMEDDNIDVLIESLNLKDFEKEYLIKDKKILENYKESELFNALKEASEVHKETPFYMNVDFNGTGEKILIQGVIDLYFIDKDGDLILVDYKTDHNVDERELKERYSNQLNMYKIAIEKSTQKKVAQKLIYSTYLNKLVEI